MAYRKKSNYRSSSKSKRRAAPKTYGRKRSSRPREQVVKIVLQHQQLGQAVVPVQSGEGMALPAAKPKQSKL